jgi:hypothetical protein
MKKKTKQKLISINLEKDIMKFKKELQLKENIKFGRKAKSISFVDATSKPKSFAKFLLRGTLK